MSTTPQDRAAVPGDPPQGGAAIADGHRRIRPTLASWLAERVSRLANEWIEEIRVRGNGADSPRIQRVNARFVTELTALLPHLMGPRGEQLMPLWIRACELLGAVAARRGLAAGEPIEEFQILRALIIRELFEDPPGGTRPRLREVLRLNRIVDRGVSHTSIGHTDAMFFHLLERSDTPMVWSPEELAEEVDAQLAMIREEMDAILENRAN
ncbi:MAG TPA: hypothetical protein VFQ22_07760 [Longimicrobiales bacterium]|nr:hypothetical protein [Longimicrobiales bacterium]